MRGFGSQLARTADALLEETPLAVVDLVVVMAGRDSPGSFGGLPPSNVAASSVCVTLEAILARELDEWMVVKDQRMRMQGYMGRNMQVLQKASGVFKGKNGPINADRRKMRP